MNLRWANLKGGAYLQMGMKKYECIIKRDGITTKAIRYFSDSKYAFVWLALEGYKVISVKKRI